MKKLFFIIFTLVSLTYAQNEIYISQSRNDISNEIFTVDEKNLTFDINYLDKIAQKAIYQAKSLSNKNSREYTSIADLKSDLFGRENRLFNLFNKIDKEKISESCGIRREGSMEAAVSGTRGTSRQSETDWSVPEAGGRRCAIREA